MREIGTSWHLGKDTSSGGLEIGGFQTDGTGTVLPTKTFESLGEGFIGGILGKPLSSTILGQTVPSLGLLIKATATSDEIEILADGVVLVTQRVSSDDLYRELTGDPEALAAGGIAGVYRIGDCVAPRMLREVVFDGHRLAREIDSSDPAIAKPFAREGAAHRVEAPTVP